MARGFFICSSQSLRATQAVYKKWSWLKSSTALIVIFGVTEQ